MVGEQPTRSVLKELRRAGFDPIRARGSHTLWAHPTGTRVVVPDGHGTVSPGVYRQVLAAVATARRTSGPDEEE